MADKGRAKNGRRREARRSRPAHWDAVYSERDERELSWYEPRPAVSLRLIEAIGLPERARVLDVGGGTSRLAERLVDAGLRPGVLDVSERALALARERLGVRAAEVEWIRADVTRFRARERWDVWHDRAVLHFLTDEEDRHAYAEALGRTLAPGGLVVLGTFAPDGPERCSGLPVRRHGVEDLHDLLGAEYVLEDAFRHEHRTPAGAAQSFQFARFRRSGG